MQPPYEATMGINSSDPSFDLTANADFLVWDRELGFELLGSNPQNEFMFEIAEAVHDAPVYAPDANEFYFSQLEPDFPATTSH